MTSKFFLGWGVNQCFYNQALIHDARMKTKVLMSEYLEAQHEFVCESDFGLNSFAQRDSRVSLSLAGGRLESMHVFPFNLITKQQCVSLLVEQGHSLRSPPHT